MTRPQPRRGILDIAPYVSGPLQGRGDRRDLQIIVDRKRARSRARKRSPPIVKPRRIACFAIRTATRSRWRAAIATRYGLKPDRLIRGAGSDDIADAAGAGLSRLPARKPR